MNSSLPDNRSPFTSMRQQIRSTPMPSAAVRRLPVRPRLAVGGLAATAATTVGLAAGLGAFTGAAPAFAVSDHPDGTVTITLQDLQALPALNARLAADGDQIRAVPVVAGCDDPVQVVGVGTETLHAGNLQIPADNGLPGGNGVLGSITIQPPSQPGRTVVLAVTTDGLQSTAEVVEGTLPTCVGPSS